MRAANDIVVRVDYSPSMASLNFCPKDLLMSVESVLIHKVVGRLIAFCLPFVLSLDSAVVTISYDMK